MRAVFRPAVAVGHGQNDRDFIRLFPQTPEEKQGAGGERRVNQLLAELNPELPFLLFFQLLGKFDCLLAVEWHFLQGQLVFAAGVAVRLNAKGALDDVGQLLQFFRVRGSGLRSAPAPVKRCAMKTAVERRLIPPADSTSLLVTLLISYLLSVTFFCM